MPMPSKFTESRRRVILAALGCGASRRTAAKLASIDHQTLGRWIERGRTSSPGGRWRQFFEDVLAAEAAEPRPALLPLPVETSARELRIAERLIFGGKVAVPDAEIPRVPTVKITLADWEPEP